MAKPVKHAISVIIKNKKGETLFAQRSPHKKEFPLIWSLPSHFMKDGEQSEDTISRIGLHKLGVKLKPIHMLNEGYGERPEFRLFMHDYLVEIVSGKVQIASDDFVDLKWANAEEFLPMIKIKGDCTRLYGEYLVRG